MLHIASNFPWGCAFIVISHFFSYGLLPHTCLPYYRSTNCNLSTILLPTIPTPATTHLGTTSYIHYHRTLHTITTMDQPLRTHTYKKLVLPVQTLPEHSIQLFKKSKHCHMNLQHDKRMRFRETIVTCTLFSKNRDRLFFTCQWNLTKLCSRVHLHPKAAVLQFHVLLRISLITFHQNAINSCHTQTCNRRRVQLQIARPDN
jgi:hypothetical protein